MEFDIAPIGISAALAELRGIATSTEKGGKKALQEIAPLVVEKAKQNIRDEKLIDTGALLESVKWKPTGNGFTVYTDLTGERSDYDYYQEFGFYHIHAGRWVPGKFYISKAVYSYITGETDNKIFDQIEDSAKLHAVFGAALSLAENITRLGNLSIFDTFLLSSLGNIAYSG
jgi:hypothetical protein